MNYSNTARLPHVRALPFFFQLDTAPVSRRIPFPEGSEGGGGARKECTTLLVSFFKPSLKTAVFPV